MGILLYSRSNYSGYLKSVIGHTCPFVVVIVVVGVVADELKAEVGDGPDVRGHLLATLVHHALANLQTENVGLKNESLIRPIEYLHPHHLNYRNKCLAKF